MFTTIATLKYRNHVPYGWVATEFCHLDFMGIKDDLVKSMNDQWHNAEFEKHNMAKEKIVTLNANKELLSAQVSELESKYKQSKKWYRLANKYEKSLLNEIEQKRCSICDIETAIEQLESDKFFSASELHKKASELLVKNNFILISKSSAGNECITHTEIWHRKDDV
jgi:hypothetical protein